MSTLATTALERAIVQTGDWSTQRRISVALLHITIALLGTISTGKGVFFPYLVTEFGISHAAGAALISISSLVGGVVAFAAGWLMLKLVRVHWVLSAVPLVSAIGYLTASFAQNYSQLVVGYLLMSGTLVNQVGVAYLLAQWFTVRRGLALALVYAGTTTSGVLLNPLISQIVETWSWRVGYQAIAVSLLVLPPLLFWLTQVDSKDVSKEKLHLKHSTSAEQLPGLTIAESLTTRSFWLILLANFIFGANTGAYFVHFIALMKSIGYAPLQAAWTMSQLFLLAAGAKVLFGHLADRIDIRFALAIAFSMSAIGWFVLYGFDSSQSALYFFIVAFGLSYSGPLVLFPLLATAVFGKRHFTLIDAVITVVGLSIGGAVGPILAGWIFDVFGSYNLMFLILGGSLVLATITILFTRSKEISNGFTYA